MCVILQPLSGSFANKYGSKTVTMIGSLPSFLGIILLPFTNGLSLIVDSDITSAGIGIVWTVTSSGAAEEAGQGRMGPVIGNLGSYKEVGDMAGPIIVGSLSLAASLQVGFAASGLLAGFVILPLLAASRGQKTPRPS